jgi:hypothetical protein
MGLENHTLQLGRKESSLLTLIQRPKCSVNKASLFQNHLKKTNWLSSNGMIKNMVHTALVMEMSFGFKRSFLLRTLIMS